MKLVHAFLAAGFIAASLVSTEVSAASLLGGLINTGWDSGNSGGLISSNSNGSIGVGGSNGVSVNLGGATGGGSSGGGLLGGGSGGSSGGSGLLGSGGSLGVPGVAEVTTGNSSGGGTNLGVTLLGGGGTSISTNPLGLLGNGGNAIISLPGLGGSNGTPGTPGSPGAPGAPGAPGSNGYGYNGANGYNGYNGVNGRNGFIIPGNISSRLRTILAMLAARDWIRMVNGRAICLNGFGVAEVSTWLPQKDWAGFNAALPQYAADISSLRQLLANCRSSAQRQALNVRDLNRVIGIDIDRNGTPVLYML